MTSEQGTEIVIICRCTSKEGFYSHFISRYPYEDSKWEIFDAKCQGAETLLSNLRGAVAIEALDKVRSMPFGLIMSLANGGEYEFHNMYLSGGFGSLFTAKFYIAVYDSKHIDDLML